jgi:hypothetical protein
MRLVRVGIAFAVSTFYLIDYAENGALPVECLRRSFLFRNATTDCGSIRRPVTMVMKFFHAISLNQTYLKGYLAQCLRHLADRQCFGLS